MVNLKEAGEKMNECFDTEYYMNKRVVVKSSKKVAYVRDKIIGKNGTIIKASACTVGVLVDGKYNKYSDYGVYWFEINEIEILNNESEDIVMEGFKYVAIVNLRDDYNKKDYAFALYDEDYEVLNSTNSSRDYPAMVVVNANSKDSRLLGTVKEFCTVEKYYSVDKNRGRKITAEVVGVVNMNRYIAREEEKVRLAELEKKKAAIERELEEEINKRKSVEYYEAMAQKYSDNPKLAELVAELKNLGS